MSGEDPGANVAAYPRPDLAEARARDQLAKLTSVADLGRYRRGWRQRQEARLVDVPPTFLLALRTGQSGRTLVGGHEVTYAVAGDGTGHAVPHAELGAWAALCKIVADSSLAPSVVAGSRLDMPPQLLWADWVTEAGLIRVQGRRSHRGTGNSRHGSWPVAVLAPWAPIIALAHRFGEAATPLAQTATVTAAAVTVGCAVTFAGDTSSVASVPPASISRSVFVPSLIDDVSPTPSPTTSTRHRMSAPGPRTRLPSPRPRAAPTPPTSAVGTVTGDVPTLPVDPPSSVPAVSPPAVQGVPTGSPPVAVPTDAVPSVVVVPAG
jgi:hypothetical protein